MIEKYDLTKSICQKKISRVIDEINLALGIKTQEDLRKENGSFCFPNAKFELKNGC